MAQLLSYIIVATPLPLVLSLYATIQLESITIPTSYQTDYSSSPEENVELLVVHG